MIARGKVTEKQKSGHDLISTTVCCAIAPIARSVGLSLWSAFRKTSCQVAVSNHLWPQHPCWTP
jgi:hypothetical protein